MPIPEPEEVMIAAEFEEIYQKTLAGHYNSETTAAGIKSYNALADAKNKMGTWIYSPTFPLERRWNETNLIPLKFEVTVHTPTGPKPTKNYILSNKAFPVRIESNWACVQYSPEQTPEKAKHLNTFGALFPKLAFDVNIIEHWVAFDIYVPDHPLSDKTVFLPEGWFKGTKDSEIPFLMWCEYLYWIPGKPFPNSKKGEGYWHIQPVGYEGIK
jgi:hypothetical protein